MGISTLSMWWTICLLTVRKVTSGVRWKASRMLRRWILQGSVWISDHLSLFSSGEAGLEPQFTFNCWITVCAWEIRGIRRLWHHKNLQIKWNASKQDWQLVTPPVLPVWGKLHLQHKHWWTDGGAELERLKAQVFARSYCNITDQICATCFVFCHQRFILHLILSG